MITKEKWYAVHTLPQSENKVKILLEKTANKYNMQNKIKEVIVPVDTEIKKQQGKKIEKHTKVFPGYVLIKMVMDEESFNFIRRTPGITSFVCVGNKPTVLKDEEINDILTSLDPNHGFKPKKKYMKDMIVRICEGPFCDFTGKVDEVNDEKEKVKVMINLFGRDTPVELEFGQVEKI